MGGARGLGFLGFGVRDFSGCCVLRFRVERCLELWG